VILPHDLYIRDNNLHALHHALVLVVEDVAVQHKLSCESLVACPHDDFVVLLDQQRVTERADLIARDNSSSGGLSS
jgi:hypothetical protein